MIDLDALCARLRVALPALSVEMGALEHSETRASHRALLIEHRKDHGYRMAIALLDDHVHFFAHVHGVSEDLTTTRGALHFTKECADVDEVFAIAHACWTRGAPS